MGIGAWVDRQALKIRNVFGIDYSLAYLHSLIKLSIIIMFIASVFNIVLMLVFVVIRPNVLGVLSVVSILLLVLLLFLTGIMLLLEAYIFTQSSIFYFWSFLGRFSISIFSKVKHPYRYVIGQIIRILIFIILTTLSITLLFVM